MKWTQLKYALVAVVIAACVGMGWKATEPDCGCKKECKCKPCLCAQPKNK